MIGIWIKIYIVSDCIIPPKTLQEIKNNIGLTSSVGYSTLRFTINFEQDK